MFTVRADEGAVARLAGFLKPGWYAHVGMETMWWPCFRVKHLTLNIAQVHLERSS